jgi:hypothetical protein
MSHVVATVPYTYVNKTNPPPDVNFIKGVLAGAGLVHDDRANAHPPNSTVGDWVGCGVSIVGGVATATVTISDGLPSGRPVLSTDLPTAEGQLVAILAGSDVAP